MASHIVERGAFKETPIYIPELITLFAGVSFSSDPQLDQEWKTSSDPSDPLKLKISFRGPEMRPYVRFAIARELFFHLLRTKDSIVSTLAQHLQR